MLPEWQAPCWAVCVNYFIYPRRTVHPDICFAGKLGSSVVSSLFLRWLHSTHHWTRAAGQSLFLRLGSSKADLEIKTWALAGHLEMIPGKLGGVRSKGKAGKYEWGSRYRRAAELITLHPFGQLRIRWVSVPLRGGPSLPLWPGGPFLGCQSSAIMVCPLCRESLQLGGSTQRRESLVHTCSYLRPFLQGS